MEADFSGYATKANLKCSDGRVITAQAFAHMDGKQVPLVWQHRHNEPQNVLGYAILSHKEDGIWAEGFFNDTVNGQNARKLVQHKDVDSMSIYANQLVEKGSEVLHGMIREVSLVLSGANPGARILNVRLAHSEDDIEVLDDEAFIFSGTTLAHSADPDEDEDEGDEDLSHAGTTVQDVYDSLTEEQKSVVHYMIGAALEAAADDAGSDSAQHDNLSDDNGSDDNNSEGDLTHQEGNDMSRNLFESADGGTKQTKTLSHSEFVTLMEDAQKLGSFKKSVLAHAGDYGIDNIEYLFPEAKLDGSNPQLHSREMGWVQKVIDGTKKLPFANVRTLVADITADEARAKGYVKGARKVEEVFGLLKRSTSPTTIYKKQKLDRDDILDITDMDVVAFLKAEIRLMLLEELARAILVGDGRSNLNPDKVKDPAGAIDGAGIRSILNDDDFYAIKHRMVANTAPKDAVKEMVRARSKYRGSGKPTMFVSDAWLTEIMLEEDKFGRPLYETEAVLADKLRVKEIVTVEVFDDHDDLFAIMVNLQDYSVGTNKGGELTSFEDFDIDFNQHKYLLETRLSGGLNKPLSAIVILREEGTAVTGNIAPTFDTATNTITIPNVTGVVYEGNDVPLAPGAHVIDETTEVQAFGDEGYYLPAGTTDSWTFTYTA